MGGRGFFVFGAAQGQEYFCGRPAFGSSLRRKRAFCRKINTGIRRDRLCKTRRRGRATRGKQKACVLFELRSRHEKRRRQHMLSAPCRSAGHFIMKSTDRESELYAMAMVFFSGALRSGALGKEILRMPSSNVAETSFASSSSPT